MTKLNDEPARLAALYRYAILDTAPEAPFDRITDLVKTLLNVPMATVSLIDTQRQWFLSPQGLNSPGTARDISFCTYTIRSYEPMVISDARQHPLFRENPLVTGPPFIGSYAGMPLQTADGYNVGALCVLDTVPREFDAGQIAILKNFAPLVIGELELRRVAQMDQLTGALTRRGFIAEADNARARLERYHRPSAMLLLDLDHFKSVNDVHGHPVGDMVLRAVADICRATLREGDVLGRIGGEEFAILLSESDIDDAISAAERFRAALEGMIVAHTTPLRITASFGITPLWEGCASTEDWLARADLALYAAKHAGRNCCRVSQSVLTTVAA